MLKKCLRLLLLAALMVPIGANAQSILLNEGFEEGIPDTWSTIHVSGNNYWSASSSYHHTGAYSAYIQWANSGHENYLVTPQLTPETGDSLIFWVASQSWAGTTLSVKVSTTTTEGSAFSTTLASYTTGSSGTIGTTSTSTFVRKAIDVSSYVGQNIFIAFHVSDDNGSSIILDDVTGIHMVAPTCFRVQAIAASEITTDGMTIHWTDTLNTSTYTLTYWAAGASTAEDTVTVTALSDTTYEISNLESFTAYFFSVVPDCSDGSIAPRAGSAQTLLDCENGTCNITIYAEDSYGDGWNGNAISVLSASGAEYGTYSMPTQGLSGTRIYDTVSFQVCNGSPVILTFTVGSYPSEMGGYVADGGGTAIFTIEDMANLDNDTLAIVANPCPSCLPPTALADSVDEDGNIIFSWTSETGSYLVYVGDSLVTESPISDNYYTFTDLSASTAYQLGVAAVCGSEEGDTSGIVRRNVFTPCGAISAMPWSTSFETDESEGVPLCWTRVNTAEYEGEFTPEVYEYSYYAHTGSKSLIFAATYDDDTACVVSSPIVYNPGNIHVSFYCMGYNYGGTFQAGMMTNPNDPSTFRALITLSDDISYNYTQYEFFTDTLGYEEGDTAYLAFRAIGGEGESSWYSGIEAMVDDISLTAIPNCRMPLSGSGNIDSVTYESAYFSWNGVSEDGYDLALVHFTYNDTTNAVEDTIINHIFCDSTSITVNTLLPDTRYYAYVATLCANEDGGFDTTDYLYMGYFTTQLRCYPVYRASLDAINNNSAVISWHYRNMGIAPAGAVLTFTDLTDATVAPVVENVLNDSTKTYTGLTVGHSYSVTLTTLCGTADSAKVQTVYFTPHAPECAQYYTDAQASTTSSYPVYSSSKYSWMQAIYADTVLRDIDNLSGMAFKSTFGSNTPGVINATVDLYLGYADTADLTLLSGQYYLPAALSVDSGMTKVVDGYHMSVTGNDWVYIPFDTVFAVTSSNNSKRLVVTAVSTVDSRENGTCSWVAKSDYYYYYDYSTYTSTSAYKARISSSSSNPIDPTTVTGSTSSYVPNIQFFGNCEQGCVAPNASASASTGNSISVQWLANGEETSWKVEYKLPADTVWTLATTATASPYTITGLTSGTSYQVRVGAVCTDTVVYCAPFTVTTACVAVVPPYSVTFTSANPCWTASNSPNSSYGYNIWSSYSLISPEMGISLDTLAITINARTYSEGSNSTGLQIMACDADGSNAVAIDTINVSNTTFSNVTVYLMNYSGTQNHFKLMSANGGDVYVKSVSIDYLPSCMPVSNVSLDTATPNSMTLSWAVHSPNSGFTVNYRLAGDTTWSTTAATGSTATLTGLRASSIYEVQVVTNCTDGTTMSTAVSQFATECVPETVPYEQTYFTSMPACWSNSYTGHPGTSWQGSTAGSIFSEANGNTSATNDWLMTPAIVIPTTAAADSVMAVYQIAGDGYDIVRYELLVAPNAGTAYADFTDTLIVDTNLTGYFEFRRLSLASYAGDTIRLAFRNTSNYYGEVDMYDFGVRSVLAPRYYLTGNGQVFTDDTNGYKAVRDEGDTTTVTFVWTSTMAAAGNATMTGETTDSLTIIYTASGIDTLMCIVNNAYGIDTNRGYVRVVDLAPVSRYPYTTGFETTNNDNNSWVMANGANAWTIGSATNNGGSRALYISNDGGAHNTYNNSATTISYAYRAFDMADTGDYTFSYDWKAYGEGSWDFLRVWLAPGDATLTAGAYPDEDMEDGDTDTPAGWFDLNPAGGKLNLDSTWNTVVDSVHITTPGRYFLVFMWRNDGSLGTNPPAAIDNIVVNNGGSLFCAAPVIDTVLAGETSILMGFSSEAETFEVAIVEGQWNEPLAGDTVITDTFYTFNGLTPATQYTVGVRAVCDEDFYSEWVYQTVTTEAHPCDVPTALAASNVTLNSATLGWTNVEGQTAWQIAITGTDRNDIIDVTTKPYQVNGLTHGVTYTFMVRAICSEGDTSVWSAPATFTTRSCEGVTDVTVNSVTSNSAVVSWTAPAGATRFVVNYGTRGFDQGTGSFDTVENATSCTLTGLLANMPYDVYVRTLCDGNAASLWSVVAQFTTERAGIDDVVNAAISLYPNPASSTVTLKGIEGKATVTVVDMNGRKAGEWTVSNGQLTIDVTEMAQGAYFVRIVGEQVNAIRKLIVR